MMDWLDPAAAAVVWLCRNPTLVSFGSCSLSAPVRIVSGRPSILVRLNLPGFASPEPFRLSLGRALGFGCDIGVTCADQV